MKKKYTIMCFIHRIQMLEIRNIDEMTTATKKLMYTFRLKC